MIVYSGQNKMLKKQPADVVVIKNRNGDPILVLEELPSGDCVQYVKGQPRFDMIVKIFNLFEEKALNNAK